MSLNCEEKKNPIFPTSVPLCRVEIQLKLQNLSAIPRCKEKHTCKWSGLIH